MKRMRFQFGNLLVACAALLLWGCVDYKLSGSIWANTSHVEKDGVQGDLISVLQFKSVDSVDYYCFVKSDTGMIVRPFKYAGGMYAQSGNPRKEANVVMKLISIRGEALPFYGVYHKADAMLLMSSDTVMRVFERLENKGKR